MGWGEGGEENREGKVEEDMEGCGMMWVNRERGV